MSLKWIKSQPTFLSKDVNDILLKVDSEVEVSFKTADNWLSSYYEINWENVEKTLSDITDVMGSKGWFQNAVEKMAPLFRLCDKSMKEISLEDYLKYMQPYLKWTHQEEVVSSCIKLLQSEDSEAVHLLALLIITSLAERALGNLLLTRRKQIPFLLRDLLITPELQEILGKPRIQLLVVLLGSVLGLNLRNIAWHGFLSPTEAKSSFVATIIFILSDCGHIGNISEFEVDVPKRLQISYNEEKFSSVFVDMTKPCRSVMEDLISKSPLVPDIMMPVWTKILDLLEEKRYGLCAILLLPMLECSMRCLFAHVNGTSARVLTAENSCFYTTLDEILQLDIALVNTEPSVTNVLTKSNEAESITTSSSSVVSDTQCHDLVHESGSQNSVIGTVGKSNLVPHIIGKQINEALHDLLNFVNGPRVRDKLSHGEVQIDHIPEALVYHIFYICLLLLTLGNWRSEPGIEDKDNSSVTHVISERRKDINSSCSCSNCKIQHKCDSSEAIEDICNAELCDYPCILKSIEAVGLLESTKSLIETMKNLLMGFRSVYHPSAILQKNLELSVVQLENWTKWERVNSTDLCYPNWETSNTIELPKFLSCSLCTDSVHKVMGFDEIDLFKSYVERLHYNVLYLCKSELELVSILNRIVLNIQLALENIKENLALKYSQYINKTLRSRQRETYRRQLTAVPTIILNCYITSQIIYYIFKSCNSTILDRINFSEILKILKNVLKCHENIVSQCSIHINRWEEALKLSIVNINNFKEFFGK